MPWRSAAALIDAILGVGLGQGRKPFRSSAQARLIMKPVQVRQFFRLYGR